MNRLYHKLAFTNIKNGRQFYIPYFLTGILTVAMFYTMVSMQQNEGLSGVPGAGSLKSILAMGTFVIGIFIFIFLFYTNSFIIKRRKRELGIYNILGMEKKHISRVLFVEVLMTAAVSIGGGLTIGIVFNKLLMMALYAMIGFSSTIQFYISWRGVYESFILFGIIYLMAFAYNMLQVKLSKPVELLHGGNVGEREPKTKILMTVIGIISLAAGYYISIVTKNPLEALNLFFVAVILVIIGTYCLFTAGSIAVLKMLRNNKKFYYQTKHFTAVSGMIYRMKQNAVGLANICILSTMVLVMLSTTVSMFIGVEDELKARYVREIYVQSSYEQPLEHEALSKTVHQAISDSGRSITEEEAYESMTFASIMKDDTVIFDENEAKNMSYNDITLLTCMTKETYEQLKHVSLPAVSGEDVMLIGTPTYSSDKIHLFDQEYIVKQYESGEGTDNSQMASLVAAAYYIILPDNAAMENLYQIQKAYLGEKASNYNYTLYIDIDGSNQEKIECDQAVEAAVKSFAESTEAEVYLHINRDYMQLSRGEFFSIYGGLFFLGLFLGTMFLMVTVLIIFYKQISEGYEDKDRFAIMEKVGMSSREVKTTIDAQVRMVFFLPILTATIHVIAAFPMIKRLLAILNLTNSVLFAWCLVGTVLVFSVIYFVVFKITSRSYYKIVGNQIR